MDKPTVEKKMSPKFIKLVAQANTELDPTKLYTFRKCGLLRKDFDSTVTITEEAVFVDQVKKWMPLRYFKILDCLLPN